MPHSRKKGFSTFDRTLLLLLINKYDEVKNKDTSAMTKRKLWLQITSEFNKSTRISQHLNTKQLKKLWDNLKFRVKNVPVIKSEESDNIDVKFKENMETKKHVFSALEKATFTAIFAKYANILENKQTDGATLQCKNKAWHELAKEYNASSNVLAPVTPKQLRRLWINLKQRHKETLKTERQHRFATGSDDCSPMQDIEIDEDITQLTPELLVCIDDGNDSDASFESATPSDPFANSDSEAKKDHIDDFSANPGLPQRFTPKFTSKINNYNNKKEEIIEKEYFKRQKRLDEIHSLQIQLMSEQVREAKAKADLAELLLRSQQENK